LSDNGFAASRISSTQRSRWLRSHEGSCKSRGVRGYAARFSIFVPYFLL
jgi:hypothetical protein